MDYHQQKWPDAAHQAIEKHSLNYNSKNSTEKSCFRLRRNPNNESVYSAYLTKMA
jgi:hypothetical protein